VDSFAFVAENSRITFVKLSNNVNPTLEISFVIDHDWQPNLHVSEKLVSSDHAVWTKFPAAINSVDAVKLTLEMLVDCTVSAVCSGVTDSKLCYQNYCNCVKSCKLC